MRLPALVKRPSSFAFGAIGASLLGGGALLLGPLCAPSHGAAPAFDLAALRPYFEGGPLADVPRRLRAGDTAAALPALSAYLDKNPKAKDRLQARFLLALGELRDRSAAGAPPVQGEGDGVSEAGPDKARGKQALSAAKGFDALAHDYPLLLPYHRLYAARAYLQAGRPAEALARAKEVPDATPLRCEAAFTRAEALRRLVKPPKDGAPALEAAEAAYAAYLSGCDGGRRYEALARRAELLAALGREAEALPLWRRIYLEDPLSGFGAQADRALDRQPEAARRFTAKELLGRAQVFFDNMRNPESEAAYRRVLTDEAVTERDEAAVCTARFQLAQSVFKQRQRPRAAPLFDEAAAACEKNEDLHIKALYQGARCYGSRGELQKAADLFARAEAAHPGHSYADDARLRQAEMYADLEEKLARQGPQAACGAASCPDYAARVTDLLATLPERYAAGDQRAEALWRLALRAYRKKDLAAAERHLKEALGKIPRETGWDQEGRTLYWLGRVAELSNRGDEATEYFRRTCREYPLSFYTLLALSRLKDKDPQALSALLTELTAEPAGTSPEVKNDAKDDARTFRFADRPLFHEAGFLRAVELLRLGLGGEAQRELGAVGVKLPEGKGYKPASAEEEELLWLAALLYQGAGDFHRSHWTARHSLTAHQRHYPVGPWRKAWLVSYPRGYEELLVPAARKNGQPEALQLAIVREESAFDPLTESFANAIGLTQMIPPTAARFTPGLPTTREALRDPAINVAIGSRFLGFLWSTMQGHPALAVAGYNAGEGAVFRWLRQRGDLPADAFVETIPFDETRGYTKRVLASFLVYSWLYGDGDLAARLPVVPLRLPALPQARAATPQEADPHRK